MLPGFSSLIAFACSLIMTGCGMGLILDPRGALSLVAQVDFGTVIFGSQTTQTVTISNPGLHAVTGISPGTMPSGFAFTGGTYPGTGGTCGSTLDSGGSCTLVLTYTGRPPAGAGTVSFELSFFDGTANTSASLQFQVTPENGSFSPALTGLDGVVIAIANAGDSSGDVYVGGWFANYLGSSANHIVRIKSDGARSTTFSVGTGFDSGVRSLCSPSSLSGKVYVGGLFGNYKGVSANYIARLNADGTRDTDFNVGTGFDGSVETIVEAADGSGDIYVGGAFTTYQGVSANSLIRLNNDGSRDNAFNVGTGFDDVVYGLAVETDGSEDVYVAGDFTTYKAVGANGVIRLNNDGSRDAVFNMGAGFNASVSAVVLTQDGSDDIFVGGGFTSYNGFAINRIVRINNDGSRDASFNPGTGFIGSIWTLSLARDGSGDLYGGGTFTSFDGTGMNYAIRLNADGSRDTAFDIGTGFDTQSQNVCAASDGSGDVYVGGDFVTYKGAAANYIVRLNSSGAVD